MLSSDNAKFLTSSFFESHYLVFVSPCSSWTTAVRSETLGLDIAQFSVAVVQMSGTSNPAIPHIPNDNTFLKHFRPLCAVRVGLANDVSRQVHQKTEHLVVFTQPETRHRAISAQLDISFQRPLLENIQLHAVRNGLVGTVGTVLYQRKDLLDDVFPCVLWLLISACYA